MNIMKIALALGFTLLWSAPSLEGGQGLHRTKSAGTLGEQKLEFSLGMDGGWGTSIVDGKVNTTSNGNVVSQDLHSLHTSSWYLGFSMGFDDDWDGGFVLPLHVDLQSFSGSSQSNLSDAKYLGVGDFKFWSKHRLPIFRRSNPWQMAGQVEGSLNTGTEIGGFIPKHRSVIPANSKQKLAPYSASISTIAVGGAISWLGAKVKSDWNVHASLMLRKATWLDLYGVSELGIGFDYQPIEWFAFFAEYANEVAWSEHYGRGAHHITPGARFILAEGVNLSLGADWNPFWDTRATSYTLDKDLVDGSSTQYRGYATHALGMSAVFAYNIGLDRDHDKDGVFDRDDACPNTLPKRAVNKQGCSLDTDKDGVNDAFDRCPSTPRGDLIDKHGCSIDADEDGVNDGSDACLETEKGESVDIKGCAKDSDKDGVTDLHDKCPMTAIGHKVDSKGCTLDTDKDGVHDGIDKCPTTPKGKKVDGTGCQLDQDKDGVFDDADKCPNTIEGVKVDKKGCPIRKDQDLSLLAGAINFKSGRATLTKNSKPILNKIVKLMLEFKKAKLEIQGHTDSQGRAKTNLKLSQSRAQAVVDYLVTRGVASDRLEAKGYGEEIPVATNKTRAGRAKNRRTEILPLP